MKTEKHHRHHKHCFLHEHLHLAGAGTLQAGSYSYPFTFRLPNGIPASFRYLFVSLILFSLFNSIKHREKTSVGGNRVQGKVKYSLLARVDAHHSKDLKQHVPFTVGTRIAGKSFRLTTAYIQLTMYFLSPCTTCSIAKSKVLHVQQRESRPQSSS